MLAYALLVFGLFALHFKYPPKPVSNVLLFLVPLLCSLLLWPELFHGLFLDSFDMLLLFGVVVFPIDISYVVL